MTKPIRSAQPTPMKLDDAATMRLELEALRAAYRADPNAWHDWQEKKGRKLAWALQLVARRDAASPERPEHCWCSGVGGGAPADGYTEYDYHPRSKKFTLAVICEHCPEGQAATAEAAAVRAEERQAERQDRARAFAEKLPYRFQGHTLESYPQTEPAQVALLSRIREWLANPTDDLEDWLVLHGPYGTGKSGLAVAIGKELILTNQVGSATFVAVPALLDRIRYTFRKGADESEEDVMDELRTEGLLILDDLGAERETDWATERLFTILNHRYEQQYQTIITSNLAPTELGAHIGERSMWRISEMATVIPLADCPNLRLDKAKAKRQSATPDAQKEAA